MPLRVADDWEEKNVVVAELASLLGRPKREISNGRGEGALDLLSDDWDTLAVDGSGWEKGHADPKFLSAWRQHRETLGYTLRSELVYQLLCELRADPALEPPQTGVFVVDEYQDLNRCDLATLRELAARVEADVFAAGDDDQSIYSFRHAAPAGIRRFREDYPGAERLTLSECMRCGSAVVELANWLIDQDADREPKTLVSVTDWDADVTLVRFPNQEAEAAAVARAITSLVAGGVNAQQILVLVKSDMHNRIGNIIESRLTEADIRLYRPRKQVINDEDLQRLLEYLLLAQSMGVGRVDDMALRALLQLEENGIGVARILTVVKLAMEYRMRFSTALEYIDANRHKFSRNRLGSVADEAQRILEQASKIQQGESETFDEWLTRVAAELDITAPSFGLMVQLTREVEAEVSELDSAEPVLAEEEAREPTENAAPVEPVDYVQQLASVMSNLSDTVPPQVAGRVTFTTMHGAKGLSADVVFVLQAEDEVIPGEGLETAQLNESRRLLYVSLTRAKRRLIIGACQRRLGPQRFVGDREVERRTLTRFLRDYGLTAETAESLIRDLRGHP